MHQINFESMKGQFKAGKLEEAISKIRKAIGERSFNEILLPEPAKP